MCIAAFCVHMIEGVCLTLLMFVDIHRKSKEQVLLFITFFLIRRHPYKQIQIKIHFFLKFKFYFDEDGIFKDGQPYYQQIHHQVFIFCNRGIFQLLDPIFSLLSTFRLIFFHNLLCECQSFYPKQAFCRLCNLKTLFILYLTSQQLYLIYTYKLTKQYHYSNQFLNTFNNMEQNRNLYQNTKLFFFKVIRIISNNIIKNKTILIFIQLMQIFINHSFYINPLFTHLFNFKNIGFYLEKVYPKYPLIVRQPNFMLNIILVTIMPFLMVLLISMAKYGQIYYVSMMISFIVLIIPLIAIRLSLQSIGVLQSNGTWFYLGIGLMILTLIFIIVSLWIYDKLMRLVDMGVAVGIYIKLNKYLILCVLGVKLIISFFLMKNCKAKVSQQNYVLSFPSMLVCQQCISLLMRQSTKYLYCYSWYYLLILPQIPPTLSKNLAQFKVIYLLKQHLSNCLYPQCQCQTISLLLPNQSLQQWLLKFYQGLFNNKKGFKEISEYASICLKYYHPSLKGLMLFQKQKPSNIFEEYIFFIIINEYEMRLRNGEKNNNDQNYLAPCEQVMNYKELIHNSIKKIVMFWENIHDFDDSSTFIDLIMNISNEVIKIRQGYYHFTQKYEQNQQFKSLYDAFRIILLQKQQNIHIKSSNSNPFLISENNIILQMNTEMSDILGAAKEKLIGRTYNQLIPTIFRGFHDQWALQYLHKYQRVKVKPKEKPILLQNGLISNVLMTNHLIPRFNSGIQVITFILCNQQIKQKINCFYILGNINTMQILNVDVRFLEELGIKNNSRNLQIIKELKMGDFFPKMNILRINDKNPAKDLMLNSKIFEDPDNFYGIDFKHKSKRKNNKRLGKDNLNNIRFDKIVHRIFQFKISEQPLNKSLSHYRVIKFLDINLVKDKTQFVQQLLCQQPLLQDDQTKVQNKNQQIQPYEYHLPFIILVCSLVIHIIFTIFLDSHQKYYKNSFNTNSFLLSQIYTCLYFIGSPHGINMIPTLKNMWIEGFGNEGQIFISFHQFQQTHFRLYTLEKTCRQIHNTFYLKINSQMYKQINDIKLVSNIILIILGAFIIYAFIDFLLNIKYLWKIQKKVQETIMMFLKIRASDIKMTLHIIKEMRRQFFKQQYLKQQQQTTCLKNQKSQLFQIEQSAINLKQKRLSIDNAIQQFNSSNNHRNAYMISNNKSQIMKFISQITNLNTSNNFKLGNFQQEDEQCKQKLRKFQAERSFWKVVKDSWFAFGLLVVSSIILISILCCFFYLPSYLMPQLQNNIKIADIIEKKPIIILKQIEEVLLKIKLQPQESFFYWNKQLIEMISCLPQEMNSFRQYILDLDSKDNCQTLQQHQKAQCQIIHNGLLRLGQRIITQAIFQDIRLLNFSQIDFVELIKMQQKFMEISKVKLQLFVSQSIQNSKKYQQYLLIINIVGLMLSLLLMNIGLKHYGNKIKNAQSLLSIVPARISDKSAKSLTSEF